MFADLKKNKLDYCFLAVITAVFVVTFIAKRNESVYLLWLTTGYSLAYILWGIWHHHRISQLKGRIVLEYLLVGGFALVVVSTLLF